MLQLFSLKIISCLLLLVLVVGIKTLHATPADSEDSTFKKLDTIINRIDTLKIKVESITKRVDAVESTLKKDTTNTANCVVCKPNPNGIVKGLDWIVVFVPVLFFIAIMVWLMRYKFDFKKAMSENDYPTIRIKNPEYSSTNLTNAELVKKENLEELIPPTIETTYLVEIVDSTTTPPRSTFAPPPPNASISRYIAFISSMLTLVVALGISCFYIYHYIRTGCPPELTGISTLLIALGIGVMPYAFNKVAAAVGKSKNE